MVNLCKGMLVTTNETIKFPSIVLQYGVKIVHFWGKSTKFGMVIVFKLLNNTSLNRLV